MDVKIVINVEGKLFGGDATLSEITGAPAGNPVPDTTTVDQAAAAPAESAPETAPTPDASAQ